MYKQLHQLIEEKTAVVAVIGLGYVGLPNLCELARLGYSVMGVDINSEKLDLLASGKSYISDIPDHVICDLNTTGRLTLTADFTQLNQADVIFIDVPTPINQFKLPDHSFVEAAVESVCRSAKAGQLIILESTVSPNTTNDLIIKQLENQGFIIGKDSFVAYSPERINPGDKQAISSPKVIGGHTDNCSSLTALLFANNTYVVPNTVTAELAKLHENTFRFVNIALANELTKICNDLDVNPFDVINASDSKPFGFMKFTPSVGIGGHCIPVDPYYLTWYMKQSDVSTELIETAGRINDSMIGYTVTKILTLLSKHQIPLYRTRVALIGATYKKNVPDTRMTPIPDLASALKNYQIEVDVYDDLVKTIPTETHPINVKKMDYCDIATHDLTVILVDHDAIDFEQVLTHSQLILDTKNVYAPLSSRKVTSL